MIVPTPTIPPRPLTRFERAVQWLLEEAPLPLAVPAILMAAIADKVARG